MRLRLLFLSDNFPPEGNAPASRTFEHCVRWVKMGHQVTVITCSPNFPEGKVYRGYKNSWYVVENIQGIKVIRVKTYITANEGIFRRTIDYLSFIPGAVIAGLFQRRPDAVIGTSPQFFTVVAAWILSVFFWRPFIFELRDLWPASIKAVGAMGDNVLIKLLELMEMFLYRRASAIISVTYAFKKELITRGVNEYKISVIVNGVDRNIYHPMDKDHELETKYALQGKFVVGYIGTQGMAHGLLSVLAAATRLRDNPEIIFLLVGGGAESQELLRYIETKQLHNVRLVERQPKDMMPLYWSLCDVSLIHLKNNPLFSKVIPSKIFESMGMGLPIIIALPKGEATNLIEETGSGITALPENEVDIAKSVSIICEDHALREKYANASAVAAIKYSRDEQAGKMLDVICKTTQDQRS